MGELSSLGRAASAFGDADNDAESAQNEVQSVPIIKPAGPSSCGTASTTATRSNWRRARCNRHHKIPEERLFEESPCVGAAIMCTLLILFLGGITWLTSS